MRDYGEEVEGGGEGGRGVGVRRKGRGEEGLLGGDSSGGDGEECGEGVEEAEEEAEMREMVEMVRRRWRCAVSAAR